MTGKTINIIGAGISGLSAGCYGQMNGYRTRIFEMHNKPGGLCTAWDREDFTIGTSGWLTGSGPANNDFYHFWEELGVVQNREILYYKEFVRIEGQEAKVLTIYTDIDKLEWHLHELAPEDKQYIAEFIQMLRIFTEYKRPLGSPPELTGPLQPIEIPPVMTKWMGMSIRDFAQGFKNPFLKQAFGEAFPNVFFSAPEASVITVISTLALMHNKAAGYPLGGSLKMVRAMERRYFNLGGEIYYESPVAKILVENDQAMGVQLADGTKYHSDIVISAADGHKTIFDMLDGKFVNEEIQSYYDILPLYPPIIYISLGVTRLFEEKSLSVAGEAFRLEDPIVVGDQEINWLVPHFLNFDSSLAPEGSTLIRVMLASSYDYWKRLREEDRRGYKSEQERIADQVIAILDQRYPGFASQVEMCDVATPETFERYTGNWRGSWMGWVATPRTMSMHMSKTLPGLKSFYKVGAWVLDAGLAYAATSGRHVIQILCAEDNQPFVTSIPEIAHVT